MGRASRWFKSFFGFTTPRRDKDLRRDSSRLPKDHDLASLFGNPPLIPPNISPAEAAWLRSFFADKVHEDREQTRHAIAVAVASAAAADAAAKAAAAAAAVARLTGCNRGGGGGGRSGGFFGFSPKERSAAVKIQTMFRGFLARKALRALKGLVKLQALVRGFLVRKRATAALRSIQALMRAQDAARLRRSRRIPDGERSSVRECDNQSRRSSERFGDQPAPIHSLSRTPPCYSSPLKENPKILEVDDLIARPKSSSSRRTTTSASMFESDHPIMSSPQTPQFSKSYNICYYNKCYDTWDDDQLGRRPSYMAKTLSFRAKWRSQSAPRQRQRMPFLTNKEGAAQGRSRSTEAVRDGLPGRHMGVSSWVVEP